MNLNEASPVSYNKINKIISIRHMNFLSILVLPHVFF